MCCQNLVGSLRFSYDDIHGSLISSQVRPDRSRTCSQNGVGVTEALQFTSIVTGGATIAHALLHMSMHIKTEWTGFVRPCNTILVYVFVLLLVHTAIHADDSKYLCMCNPEAYRNLLSDQHYAL